MKNVILTLSLLFAQSSLGQASFTDIVDQLGGKRIIGIGEAIHGSSQISLFRHELALQFVRDAGIRTIVVEMYDDTYIRNYFDNGCQQEDLVTSLRQNDWRAKTREEELFYQELCNLHQELKGPDGEGILVVSADTHSPWAKIREIESFLAPGDNHPNQQVMDQVRTYCTGSSKASFLPWAYSAEGRPTPESLSSQDCYSTLDSLSAIAAQARDEEVLQDIEYQWVQLNIDTIRAFEERMFHQANKDFVNSMNARIQMMAKRVAFFADHYGPVLFLGHNIHVSKQGQRQNTQDLWYGIKSAGEYLSQWYGTDYASVGVTAYKANRVFRQPGDFLPSVEGEDSLDAFLAGTTILGPEFEVGDLFSFFTDADWLGNYDWKHFEDGKNGGRSFSPSAHYDAMIWLRTSYQGELLIY